MPALRDRPGDVPLLASHFLARYSVRNDKHLDGFSPDAVAALQHWDWPGNIRELEHVVERAVVLATGREIGLAELPERLVDAAGLAREPSPGHIQIPVGTPLDQAEKMLIGDALRRTGGNKIRAASLLGISPRTIYRKQAPEEPGEHD